MRMLPFDFILSTLLLATACAKSIIPLRLRPSIAEAYDKLGPKQQRLALPKAPVFSQATSHYYDAAQNSVGVLFTTADTDVEVVHFWLPLGRKVFTRDSPLLPLHPHTARITSLIHSTPSLAAPEELDRIWCEIWTAPNRTRGRNRGNPEQWKISFSKTDGLVKFADEHDRFWLGGKEVESYQCQS